MSLIDSFVYICIGIALVGSLVWGVASLVGKAVGHKGNSGKTHSDGSWSPH